MVAPNARSSTRAQGTEGTAVTGYVRLLPTHPRQHPLRPRLPFFSAFPRLAHAHARPPTRAPGCPELSAAAAPGPRARTSPRGLLRTSLTHTPNAHSPHTHTHVGLVPELFTITVNNREAYGSKMDPDVFHGSSGNTYAHAQRIFYPHPKGKGVNIQVEVRFDEGRCECPGGCGSREFTFRDGVPRGAVVRTHSVRAAAFGWDAIIQDVIESRGQATEGQATERVAVGTVAQTGATQYACSFSFHGGVSSLNLVRDR